MKKALLFGFGLAVLLVFILLVSPLTEIKISRFLANLTRDLIIEEINPVREDYGFSELKPNEKLNQAAQLKAQDMVERNYFSHYGPEGQPPWAWLEKVGYNYLAAGENLAIDVNDPEVLKNAWLASPTHAKNILNRDFEDVGIGLARGKINGRETIVVVMFLGKESPADSETEPELSAENLNVPAQEPAVTENIEDNLSPEQLKIESQPSNIFSRFLILLTSLIFRHLPK